MIEDILEINGIKFFSENKINEMQKELEEIKKVMEQINQLTNNQKIDTTITRHKKKRPSYAKKNDELYTVPKSSQMNWEIRLMNEDGEFFSKNNRKMKFTIKEVFIIQKTISRTTTVADARKLRKELNLNEYAFHRIVYNLQQGNFTKFIQQWNRQTQPKIGQKSMPVENNPEKRKESGIYS